MTSDVVIRAEGLGKKYVIGHQSERERYTALRDVMARNLRRWSRSARDMLHGQAIIAGDETEEFWALRDVDFEIRRGEVVGIIGRNGAGKSTLLKILSRITEPTEGRVTINGRVASLLEVGTGFHPELTGRENIYLNGAILGMTRAEIRRKFDEIVDFAGVEKFLDTPVKRYSSGMYVKLAFAVAAYLESDILVVDEVLAVGDIEFQRKCLGKMKEVAKGGRTVLIVSHNMGSIQNLCSSAILLVSGSVRTQGTTTDALKEYRLLSEEPSNSLAVTTKQFSSISDLHISIDQKALIATTNITSTEKTEISIHLHVRDGNKQPVVFGSTGGYGMQGYPLEANTNAKIQSSLSLLGMASGSYFVEVEIFDLRSKINGYSRSEFSFVYDGTPFDGASTTIKQAWGIGSMHSKMSILSINANTI